MSVFSADTRRRKTATLEESIQDGVQDFLSLPREILLGEIYMFLPRETIPVFFGQTCRAIRAEYYTTSSVFTAARPLYVSIDVETGVVYPCKLSGGADLIRQARIDSEAIPISATLRQNCTTPRGSWSLSDVKYVVCRVTVYQISLRAFWRFLVAHPEFGAASTIRFYDVSESWEMLDRHRLDDQSTFSSVRTVVLDPRFTDPAELPVLSFRFPRAGIRINSLKVCVQEEPQRTILREFLEKAQIGTLYITHNGMHGLQDAFRRCMQRTIDNFVIFGDAPREWDDLLASELSRRGTGNVCYRFVRTGALRSLAYAKYVTRVNILGWNLIHQLDDYLGIMREFTSVRRLEIMFELPVNWHLSMTTPDNIIFFASPENKTEGDRTRLAVIEAPAPLQHHDIQYVLCALGSVLTMIAEVNRDVVRDLGKLARYISEQMTLVVKQRLPQMYNPAWRLSYKIMSHVDPDVLLVTGHV